jgi:hypothetical protein
MSIESHGHEHEFEPQHGLPERLPRGEQLLWQGSPHFPTLALRVFHVRKVAIYFAVLMALSVANDVADGAALGAALKGVLGMPLMLAFTALSLLLALAWFTASTTVYTLTDRRVVMRVGIVLTLTFNLPLRCIAGADLARLRGGHGDLALNLTGNDRIAWLQLWPHVKPWQLRRPQPTLRAVPQAEQVAQQLVQAWQVATGQVVKQPATTELPAQTPAAQQPSQWQPSPT